MQACVLTRESTRALKSIIRDNNPSIGSAHATEAAARAFGYTTNAALLSTLNGNSTGMALVATLDLAACVARLSELTGEGTSNFKEPSQQEVAPFYAWRHFGSRDETSEAFNKWHTECSTLGLPCVSIIRRQKLARIKWDLNAIPYEIEMLLRRQTGDQIVNLLYDTFCKISTDMGPNRRAVFEGSTYYGDIDNVPFDAAVAIANRFCLVLHRELLHQFQASRQAM